MKRRTLETAVFFLDYANVNRAASDFGRQIDYGDLLHYVGAGRHLVEAYCYVPVDPRAPHAVASRVEDLWTKGYVVTTKVGIPREETYKCDFDVEITMDVMRVAIETRPEIVVLGSGDGDFVPLILELRKRGIRVEALGFIANTAREVILKSSDVIDLEAYFEQLERPEREAPEVEGGQSGATIGPG